METSLLSDSHLTTIKQWLGTGSLNLFGLPFAGKDTHGSTLAKLFDAPLLGGGDILRNIEMSDELKKELATGKLFPTDEFQRIVTPFLAKPEFKGRPLILSSVGRWKGEEDGIIQAAAGSNHPIKAAVYLHLDEGKVHERWAASQEAGDRGSRMDDAEHLLDTRIQEFTEKTLPVIEVYRQKGLLIEINSDTPKHEVIENILGRLLLAATYSA